ncbi:MAG TPA: WecB/TagA/CpsF family glycosyltransferase [Xanthobacteraceae bacterium]|jgi:exopolysaccharide biosynthesis WecB/TagA/CpsF family protein|nr:WecB/TagA/CpsF family glycosyltransferase [Xanthobacteraceae bacterium]
MLTATRDPIAEMAPPVPHIDFLNLRFALVSSAEVLNLIVTQSGAPYRYVVTPNAYDVVSVNEAPERLQPIYRKAWLSVCDSRIVRALARLEGRTLPLVTGSDLVAALLDTLNSGTEETAAKRLLIVGPTQQTALTLCARYPRLNFEVLPAPAGLSHNADARLAVARACLNRQWDIALFCVGFPAQALIAQQLDELGCQSGVALCVGAAIDFLTGAQTRAPAWIQRLGLEWAYRLVSQPGRLWRRYLVESPRIAWIFIRAQFARRRSNAA